MKKLKKIDFKKLRLIRYGVFFLSLFILASAIQIFVHNFNMQKTIDKLQQEQKYLSGQTYWLKNYYEPYLNTDYAKIFFNHQNSIPGKDEILIYIKQQAIASSSGENIQQIVKFYKIQKNNLNWQNFFLSLKRKFGFF